MKSIVLISCCKEKLPHAAPAADLYQSENYKNRLAYANSLKPDGIFILSAKHHLVELNQTLEPYDVNLADKSSEEKTEWAKTVLKELSQKFDFSDTHFIILAKADYYSELVKRLPHYSIATAY